MVNRKRMLPIGAIPASLLLLGAASWGIDRVLPEPSLPAPQVVHARPETLNYACPAGIVDPFHLDGGGSTASVWNSAGDRETSGEWTILRANTSAHTLPTTLGVMGQGGGELRGLSMTSCQLPSNDQWSVLGSSTSGEDLVLTFANPNSSPSVVTLEGYGANGPIDAKPAPNDDSGPFDSICPGRGSLPRRERSGHTCPRRWSRSGNVGTKLCNAGGSS